MKTTNSKRLSSSPRWSRLNRCRQKRWFRRTPFRKNFKCRVCRKFKVWPTTSTASRSTLPSKITNPCGSNLTIGSTTTPSKTFSSGFLRTRMSQFPVATPRVEAPNTIWRRSMRMRVNCTISFPGRFRRTTSGTCCSSWVHLTWCFKMCLTSWL
jgi:hypothetical protein